MTGSMNGRRAVGGALVLAMALGALVAVPLGQRRQFSIDLWLVVTGIWFTLLFIRGVFAEVPVESMTRRSLWHGRAPESETLVKLPRGMLALEGTVIGGRDSSRAFNRRLRPKLIEVAAHRLRNNHGVDLERQPERVAELLGDVAWMIDPAVGERSPSIEELHRLLNRLDAPDTANPADPGNLANQSTGAHGGS